MFWSFFTASVELVELDCVNCPSFTTLSLVIDRTSDIWKDLATAPKKQNLSALNHQVPKDVEVGSDGTLQSLKNGMVAFIHIMLKFLRWVCFKHANRGLLSFPPGFWAPFASHQFVNRGMIIIDHPPKNGLFFFGKVVRSRETPFFSPYVVHIPIHPGWSLKQDQLLPVPLHLLPSGSGGREAADCGDRRRCGSQCEFLAGWGTSGTRFQRLEWIQDAVIYFQMFQDSTKWALKLKLNHHV